MQAVYDTTTSGVNMGQVLVFRKSTSVVERVVLVARICMHSDV
jgi:hypothetical protein